MSHRTPQVAKAPAEVPLTELRALHALADCINRSASLDQVFPEALKALSLTTHADRAAVLLLDAGNIMRFVATDSLSETYCRAVEGHSPWAANEEQACPVLVPSPDQEPSLATLLPFIKAEGIASLAFIPIAHQGRLLGKFMLYFNASHAMPAEDVRLALTVSEYLALAISRQRAVEDLRSVNAQLEARMLRRTRQLEEANREMEAFCYSVSHDLRAPLRALDGFARILIEDAGHLLDEVDKDKLGRIIAASERMGRLMDDLLKYSRIGRTSMRLADTDLGAIAAEIAGRLCSLAPERKLALKIGEGLKVRADRGLMHIALENLLGNAWKYTGQKDEAQIEFDRREEDGQLIYFVRDNGAGFDMRYATKLFSPFQSAHSHGEFEGNGIGLAIVQRIVHRHGGRIWAESEPGSGATLNFTIWPDGIPVELQGPPASYRSSSPPA